MIYEYGDYRSFLKGWIAEKSTKNPSFSLRAVARHLDLNASFLSQVLNGKKNLSSDMAGKISEPLGLKKREREYFFCLVEAETATSMQRKETLLNRASEMNPMRSVSELGLDAFKIISQWQHVAIMQLTELTNFEVTAESVAKKLAISKYVAENSIDRLIRIGLLSDSGNGSLKKVHSSSLVSSDKKDEALRSFHKQLLEKSVESLRDPNENKYVGSSTYAIDPDQIVEAKEIIKNFKAQLNKLFDRGTNKTKVYSLIINLFELK